MKVQDRIKQEAVLRMTQSRALLYTVESLPLPVLHKLITKEEPARPTSEQMELSIELAQNLLDLDAQEYTELNLPLSCLYPEKPSQHFSRLARLMADSTTAFWRRRKRETQKFSKKIKNLDQFPDYYKRNFHHQTNGYLTEESADLYDHQVELLFRGMADPMRRRFLKPMIKKLKRRKNLKILEVGCGTGSFTQYLSKTFPNAQITALDISPAYIQYSKKKWGHLKNVDFVVGKGEDLAFKDDNFDAVVSVFLHHELPKRVRKQVMTETLRVCKDNGFWGILDSIQKGDIEELDNALSNFPINFHEPFYTNYVKNPLVDMANEIEPDIQFREEIHFMSKVVYR